MTEKIKCTLTCELAEVYPTREDAIESLIVGHDFHQSAREGIYGREQYIIARNIFPPYKYPWAVYQVITVDNCEVI